MQLGENPSLISTNCSKIKQKEEINTQTCIVGDPQTEGEERVGRKCKRMNPKEKREKKEMKK